MESLCLMFANLMVTYMGCCTPWIDTLICVVIPDEIRFVKEMDYFDRRVQIAQMV